MLLLQDVGEERDKAGADPSGEADSGTRSDTGFWALCGRARSGPGAASAVSVGAARPRPPASPSVRRRDGPVHRSPGAPPGRIPRWPACDRDGAGVRGDRAGPALAADQEGMSGERGLGSHRQEGHVGRRPVQRPHRYGGPAPALARGAVVRARRSLLSVVVALPAPEGKRNSWPSQRRPRVRRTTRRRIGARAKPALMASGLVERPYRTVVLTGRPRHRRKRIPYRKESGGEWSRPHQDDPSATPRTPRVTFSRYTQIRGFIHDIAVR